MKSKTDPELVKVTLRLKSALWDQVQHRAIDEKLSLQEIAERALEQYVKAARKAGKP